MSFLENQKHSSRVIGAPRQITETSKDDLFPAIGKEPVLRVEEKMSDAPTVNQGMTLFF